MEIAGVAREEQPTDGSQDRIADVAVLPRHRSRLDSAEEPIAHDEVPAPPELLHKGHQGGEVVAVVRVAHDDVAAARGKASMVQRRPVSPGGDIHDTRTSSSGKLLRTVGGAVVRHDDLTSNPAFVEKPSRFLNAGCEGLGFIQTRHDDRQLNVIGRIVEPGHESPFRGLPTPLRARS
jgi:hypothetical protein